LETKLTEKEIKLITILEILEIEKHLLWKSTTQIMGRKLKEREAIARSFVAKSVYGFSTTRALIEAITTAGSLRRICGFEYISCIPSESTFSRAFAEFAECGLGEKVHDELVKKHLKEELIGHISRDSTNIVGREKPIRKKNEATKTTKRTTKKKGRPRKDERRDTKELTRLERQQGKSFQEALNELPTNCDCGAKKNSKGFKETWIGFKLHVDVNDCGLPISAVLTSASLHDSQVAIPLMKMTSAKINYCYDVMDAAYDAEAINKVSKELGHVPIIDKNPRNEKEPIPMAPHEKIRYKERTVVERFNSRIKEEFGANNVMVRGAKKVKSHLMFGVIAIFADHLIKLVT